MTFQTSFNAVASIALHVTIYDANGVALAPGSLSWTALPAGASAVADATGFSMTFLHTGVVQATVAQNAGPGLVTLTFNVSAPALQATTP